MGAGPTGMRIIVNSMISSLPALFNVGLLCAFIFFISALGLTFWSVVWRALSCSHVPWLSRRTGRRLVTAGGRATRVGLAAYQ